MVVLHQFFLHLLERRLALQIELLLFLVLRDEVEVVGLHFLAVCFVFLEGSDEAADFDLEGFLC